MAFTTIHRIGNRPNAATSVAARPAWATGIGYTAVAITRATASAINNAIQPSTGPRRAGRTAQATGAPRTARSGRGSGRRDRAPGGTSDHLQSTNLTGHIIAPRRRACEAGGVANHDIQVARSSVERAGEVLTPAALDFVADLHRRFGPVRD